MNSLIPPVYGSDSSTIVLLQGWRWLVGWLVEFYGISTFGGYLMSNPFYTYNQFYFKQFSLAGVHSLIVKNISISSYSV